MARLAIVPHQQVTKVTQDSFCVALPLNRKAVDKTRNLVLEGAARGGKRPSGEFGFDPYNP